MISESSNLSLQQGSKLQTAQKFIALIFLIPFYQSVHISGFKNSSDVEQYFKTSIERLSETFFLALTYKNMNSTYCHFFGSTDFFMARFGLQEVLITNTRGRDEENTTRRYPTKIECKIVSVLMRSTVLLEWDSIIK